MATRDPEFELHRRDLDFADVCRERRRGQDSDGTRLPWASVRQLYGAALASCELSGPDHVTRALGASWRASVAEELVRHGQTMYLIDADPAWGLALLPVASSGTRTAVRTRRAWDVSNRAGGAIVNELANGTGGRCIASSVAHGPGATLGGNRSTSACGRYGPAGRLAR